MAYCTKSIKHWRRPYTSWQTHSVYLLLLAAITLLADSPQTTRGTVLWSGNLHGKAVCWPMGEVTCPTCVSCVDSGGLGCVLICCSGMDSCRTFHASGPLTLSCSFTLYCFVSWLTSDYRLNRTCGCCYVPLPAFTTTLRVVAYLATPGSMTVPRGTAEASRRTAGKVVRFRRPGRNTAELALHLFSDHCTHASFNLYPFHPRLQ